MKLARWAVAPLLALILYWPGLRAWFQDDDFVWLNLLPNVHSWSDLGYALFHPTVHGTWRPLSERAYFLTLQSLFGYSSALPFRIVAFLGQFACLALVSVIVLKVTRSRLAAFLAPVLWISSDKLALTMVWNSNFNYVAGGFFILTALWFFLRYTETNRGRDLAGAWIAFLLGLGAMELVVVFPILAATYAWACARAYLKKTIPLFAASALFTIAHRILAPNTAGAVYSMRFDSVFHMLATYWDMALEPGNLATFTSLPEVAGTAGMVLFTIALLAYAGRQAFLRNLIPVLFLSWFFTLLLPFLLLGNHVDQYYLGVPLIALAMLAADAFASAWKVGPAWRAAALALLCLYLFPSALVAHRASWFWANRSLTIRSMVMGVAEAHRLHPDRDIVLTNMDDTLFWGAVKDRCFLFLGIDNVYLAPGSEQRITPHPEIADVNNFVIPEARYRDDLAGGTLTTYAVLPSTPSDRVDVADPASAGRLGSGWYEVSDGARWIARRASLHMKSFGTQGQKLRVSGYCPQAALRNGPIHVTVSLNGKPLPAAAIDTPDAPFHLEFPLPPALPHDVQVTIEVDRTFTAPPDKRDLGLIFSIFEIR